MTYTAEWTNADANGRVTAGEHFVKISDVSELAEAINRRRLLVYQQEQDFTSAIYSTAEIGRSLINSAEKPPFDNFRKNLDDDILSPNFGCLGGVPPSPGCMYWLWPLADADENKIIVAGSPGAAQVNLFAKLNGGSDWTDHTLTAGVSSVRAKHINELRQATQWLRRGGWGMPIYFAAGIYSLLPDTNWVGEALGNNGTHELRSLGFAYLKTDHTPARGLTNVTVRPASRIYITADKDCQIEVYRCKRPVNYLNDLPTWNEYSPASNSAWQTPGCSGSLDRQFIGSMAMTADQENYITGSSVAAALQAMIDTGPQNFMVRRSDTGWQTVRITGRIDVEFDINTPPN